MSIRRDRRHDDPSDADLVRGLKRKHPIAQRLFVEQYQHVVFGLCLRMLGHRQDAEDVAQDSLIRALSGVHGFDGNRPLRPWILRIAANRCRTALANRRRRPALLEVPESIVDHRRPRFDSDGLAGELDRAIARLKPKLRLAFTLFEEQGLPYEEIAVVMKCPLGSVKTWIHRARARLATDLTRRGVRC